jgi:formylglycine-generating enzyme
MSKALGFGVMVLLSALPAWGQCPSADLTRDCFVDLADFAILAGQWLTEDPNTEADNLSLLASQWLTGNRLPADMVLIPAGTFQMGNSKANEGNSDELPVHSVTLDSFVMGRYEITNGQYCTFLNTPYPAQLKVWNHLVYASNDTENNFPYFYLFFSTSVEPYSQIEFSNTTFFVRTKNSREMTHDPVVYVTWYGAVAYCNWRSQQEGKEICYDLSIWTCDFTKNGYRLPTEAEWEYAARGGLEGSRFPWGDTIAHSQANYPSFGSASYDVSTTHGFHPTWNDGLCPLTSPVGSFPANAFGLCDMAGNVWEMCQDWYSRSYYSSSPQTNPTGPETSDWRVIRGGSFGADANGCRVSRRLSVYPFSWFDHMGFRVVLKP